MCVCVCVCVCVNPTIFLKVFKHSISIEFGLHLQCGYF